jgi:hypothetical protein
MTAGISENFTSIVMNDRAVSTIDTNGDSDAFGYRNCLEKGDARKNLCGHRLKKV